MILLIITILNVTFPEIVLLLYYRLKSKHLSVNAIEPSRSAEAQSVTVKFFLRSGIVAKHGIEFCYSTRNASSIRWKVGNGVSLTLGSLCLPCCVGHSMKLNVLRLNYFHFLVLIRRYSTIINFTTQNTLS